MDERLWVLLVKKKSGEASAVEIAELEDILKEENSGYSPDVIDNLWGKPLVSLPEMDMNKNSWNRIQRKINHPAAKIIAFSNAAKIWIAAAVIIIVAGTAFLLSQKRFYKSDAGLASAKTLNTISTRPASKTKVQLPDGTQVWLNANSQITYNSEHFGIKEREVNLSGEAFFDVVHSKNAPFVIHTANVNITVKGTAFNVKAYPKEKNIETTLIRGVIEITTTQDPGRKIIVKPNEKIIIPYQASVYTKNIKSDSIENSLYTISHIKKNEKQVLSETVWMKDKLEFDNETFNDLIPQFESWFSVNIHFGDEAVKQKKFSGNIEKETLQQTLGAMQLSFPFTYSIDGNEVWINKKK